MKIRFASLSFLVAITISLTTIGCQPPTVDLVLDLVEGDVYRYQEILTQEMTIELQSIEVTTRQRTEMTLSMVVTSVDENGNVEVEITYDRVTAEMTDPYSGTTRFDSADVSQGVPPEYEGLNRMIGQTFAVVLDSKGRVQASSGYEELMQSTSTDQEVLGQILQGMGAWYDENSSLGGITGVIGGYPVGALVEGDYWDQQTTTDPPIEMTLDAVYTVTSVDRELTTIQIEAELNASLGEFISGLGIGEATYEMSGTQTGEVVIDRSDGMLVVSTNEAVITAIMETYLEEFGGETTIVYTILQSYERRRLEE